jgi:DME family drug/metabolite transporter
MQQCRSVSTVQSEATGVLFVFITAVLWGSTGTVQTLGPRGIDPLVVAALRIIIGGFLIWIRARALGQRSDGPWPRMVVVAGAGAVALFQGSFFSAVAIAGVVVATVTAIGTTPVFAGLFSRIFLKEPLRPVWYAATVISIAGIVLLSGIVEFGAASALVTGAGGGIQPGGLVLAIVAGASYAGQTVAIRRLVADHPPELVMALLFGLAGLVLSPFLFLRPVGWLWSLHGIGTVVYLGTIPTTVAYVFFSKGLRSVDGATAGTISLAEPATASLFGFLLLGERISTAGGIGIALIGVSLALISAAAYQRGRYRPESIRKKRYT